MAEKNIFTVTATKVKGPQVNGRPPYSAEPSDGETFLISTQDFIARASGTGSVIVTSGGFEITVQKPLADIATALSASDATGT
jgi:hypothetical protein